MRCSPNCAAPTRHSSRSNCRHYLSVSQPVELTTTDEQTFAQRLRRLTPFRGIRPPRRGTAFHAWVERWFGATRLLDIDELPGVAVPTLPRARTPTDALRDRFLSSRWAQHTERGGGAVPETVIGATVIRGPHRRGVRFESEGAGWWWTGRPGRCRNQRNGHR